MTTGPGLRSASALTAALLAVVAAGRVSAHRLDELLQASRVAISDDRVDLEMDLTPSIAVAGDIISDIDGNDDGVLSDVEQRAYAARVVDAVQLSADGRRLPLTLGSFAFPSPEACRNGNGIIAIRATTPLAATQGAHTIRLRNTYRVSTSAFLANALVPDNERIAINAQHRDGVQSELVIDYTITPRSNPALPYLGATTAMAVLGAIARKGFLK